MKISLITVCYNSEKTIEETLKSVLSQTYDNYEYIIVDGNSNDKTIEIIKNYQKKFKDKLVYISEKDNGLFDAMNKGVKMAHGDIIGILNSDDILANENVFKTVNDNIKDYDGVYSDLLYLDNETMSVPVRNFISGKYSKFMGWHPAHPTLYIKKEIYDQIGGYDIKYRVSADFDFMLKIVKKGYKLNYVKDYLVYMRAGGVSTNGLKGYYKNFKESYNVLKNNKIKFSFIVNVFRIFKTFKQGITAKGVKSENIRN